MEVAVGDDVGLGDEVAHVVNVGQVLGQGGAVLGPGGGIEDLQAAVGQGGLDLGELLGSAGSGGLLVDLGDLDGAGRDGAGPVSGDLLAFGNALHGELHVGSPVDAGGDDEGVGAGVGGGAVVEHEGDAVGLALGGSAHGVGMLGEEDAAVVVQLGGAFLFKGRIIVAREGSIGCDLMLS